MSGDLSSEQLKRTIPCIYHIVVTDGQKMDGTPLPTLIKIIIKPTYYEKYSFRIHTSYQIEHTRHNNYCLFGCQYNLM